MKLIRKAITPLFITTILGTTALAGLTAVQAAGGGGGGSVPSQSSPRYDAAAEYQSGINALQAKDYKAAVTAFRRSISAAPDAAPSHYHLGLSYMGQEDYKKASRSLEKAVRLDANLIEAHRDLAIAYHKLGKGDKAQSSLSDLMSLQERCGGNCAENAKLTDAISTVKSMIAGDQAAADNGAALASIDTEAGDRFYGNAVALINEKQYDAAIAELQNAAKNLGPHPDVLTYLGFANRKLQNFDVAETYYKQALAIAPDHLGANEYFGELMIERGDMKGAKAQLAKLDALCSFGCYEAEELRRWINAASGA